MKEKDEAKKKIISFISSPIVFFVSSLLCLPWYPAMCCAWRLCRAIVCYPGVREDKEFFVRLLLCILPVQYYRQVAVGGRSLEQVDGNGVSVLSKLLIH